MILHTKCHSSGAEYPPLCQRYTDSYEAASRPRAGAGLARPPPGRGHQPRPRPRAHGLRGLGTRDRQLRRQVSSLQRIFVVHSLVV